MVQTNRDLSHGVRCKDKMNAFFVSLYYYVGVVGLGSVDLFLPGEIFCHSDITFLHRFGSTRVERRASEKTQSEAIVAHSITITSFAKQSRRRRPLTFSAQIIYSQKSPILW